MSIENCEWKPNRGHVDGSRYAFDIRSYHESVIEPAMASLHRLLDESRAMDAEDDYGALGFVISDQEDLLKSTTEAFCLALQSHFERRLRTYLEGQLPSVHSGGSLANQNWEGLQKAFKQHRGVALSEFNSFAWLELLNIVGNVCRHGDGNASAKLHAQHPLLWPTYPDLPSLFDDMEPGPEGPPEFAIATIPEPWLRRFTDAIAAFWEDVEYLNIRNIQRKTSGAFKRMAELQATWPSRINSIIYS